MVLRKIVKIDETLCDGCGQCIPNCAEMALQIIDGKAKLVKDAYCDGLGACLGYCPKDAISITEREAEPFDEEAVHTYIAKKDSNMHVCPSSTIQSVDTVHPDYEQERTALSHWPVQLNLVPVEATFFEEADLLLMADCVPIAYPNLHTSLLLGKSVVIGCPKFDDAKRYAEKLGEILKRNNVRTVTVAHMEVPCCSGLNWVIKKAMEASGKEIPLTRRIISVKGEMK